MRYLPLFAFMPVIAFSQTSIDPEAQARAVEDAVAVVLSQVDESQAQSARFAEMAKSYCEGGAEIDDVKASWLESFKAWEAIDAYQFGPIEQLGAALYVDFWPDKKGFVDEHLAQIEGLEPEAQMSVEAVRSVSAAAQGLPAAEALLYVSGKPCPAIIGVSANVAQFGQEIADGWHGDAGWAQLMLSAGADNPVYHNSGEALAEIYDALHFGIERAEMKLKEPLGEVEHPFPKRAEAWRSDQSKALLEAQLSALQRLVREGFPRLVFQPDRLFVEAKFDDAIGRVDAISMPIVKAVEDVTGRFEVEAAWTRIDYLKDQIDENVGAYLGVVKGFTPADGD